MRICFLAHASSANTRSWANHLADSLGHDVHVVSLCHSDGLSDAVTLHVVPSRCRGIWAYAAAVPRVKRLVGEIGPEVVIGYRIPSYGFLAATTGFHPLVLAAQGRVVTTPNALLKRLLVSYAFPRADLINSWGPHMTRRLVELGANPDAILTCPRGIDLAFFGPGEPDASRSSTVVVSRTLHRAYHHDTMLRAVALALRDVPALRCVIAGDGEARGELEALAMKLGISDRVDFPGVIGPDRLAAMLRSARVYASTVRSDGVSASLLEAMASGSYPVVMDNEANRLWITDGENGTLVGKADPTSLAGAVVEAMRDGDRRARAAALNREIVERRADLERNMRTIERAYVSLVRAGAGGRA